MAKYLVTDVEWDINEYDIEEEGGSVEDVKASLPTEFEIEAEDEYDSLSDAISDEYGFCVLNYNSKEIF